IFLVATSEEVHDSQRRRRRQQVGHKDHAENVAKAFHLCLPAILAAGGLDRSVFAEGRAGHSLPGRAGGTDLLVAVPHKAVDNNPLPRGSAARVGASAGTLRYPVRQPSRGPKKRGRPPACSRGISTSSSNTSWRSRRTECAATRWVEQPPLSSRVRSRSMCAQDRSRNYSLATSPFQP